MHIKLKTSAQKVQEALDSAGIEIKVVELPNSTRTASDAAKSIGCEISQIAKSLIFKTVNSSNPVLVIASGPNKVLEETIGTHLGESIVKADAEYIREVTGFAIGGIPPLGHQTKIDLIFIDQDLLKFEEVWAAAGTPNAVFRLKSQDLTTLTKGVVISLTEQV